MATRELLESLGVGNVIRPTPESAAVVVTSRPWTSGGGINGRYVHGRYVHGRYLDGDGNQYPFELTDDTEVLS